ncbi:sensor histidine kinase [Streptomyces sp. HB2AG]|uniref:sensor histidine kinase n=2 Tax=unclassified Streptomyces TaxID=2593676 RepID=UPI0022AA63FC|nr:sensor histidine kinase [Streptomyces sp. HB2AG]MCZ2525650.1 histidine kinase [Streptomyces sp. HB2AG]
MTTTGAAGEGGGAEAAGRRGEDSGAGRRDGPRRGTGPLWWPRTRGLVLDAVLAAASAAECVAEGIDFADRTGMPALPVALLGLMAGATLLLRRRWPVVVVLVALAVAPAQMGSLLAVVGLYTVAASDVPRRVTAVLAGLTVVGTLLVAIFELQRDFAGDGYRPSMLLILFISSLMALGMTAPPVLLGLYVGARRRLVESLRERADGLERELLLLADKATERAERARIEERTRIAREMHDVVAHRVSLMVVHAGALQSVALRDPEKAVRSAQLLGDMGRQALDELREMLGVLRTHEPAAPGTPGAVPGGAETPVRPGLSGESGVSGASVASGAPGSVGTAEKAGRVGTAEAPGAEDLVAVGRALRASPRRDAPAAEGRAARTAAPGHPGSGPAAGPDGPGPAPGPGTGAGAGMGDIPTLVEESRAAGMRVEVSWEGEERVVGGPVGRTAYRVVQEALTNVHKHAAGADALVRVAYRTEEVAVLVQNGPSDGSPDAGLPSGGNGLVGMRERVAALGGGFVAGPTQDGGFRVSAVIPDRTPHPGP